VREDPGRRHTIVPDWVVEMRVGDTTVEARGELLWVPAPSTTPWWVVAVVAFAVTAVAALSRTWRPALAAAVVVLVVADVVDVLGLELAGVGGTGSALARVVTDGSISVVSWVAGVLAVALLVGGDDLRRHEAGALVAALVGLLIGACGGLVQWGDVGRSQVLFAWPGFVFRLATALSLGAGFGVAAGVAGRLLRQVTRDKRVLTTEPR